MFQDIEPYHYSNDFALVDPEPEDRILIYRGESVLVCREGDEISFPSFSDLGIIVEGKTPRCVFLFTVGTDAYFFADISASLLDDVLADDLWSFVPTNELHHFVPDHRVFAGIVGYQYWNWYETRRYCGRCATPLVHDLDERMMRCPECGALEFPKLFPAVIVGITHGDKVLVSRYAQREYKRFALIAGFAEAGETIEETVHREVTEEVGLKVKNLRYYKSQPWPFSSSLLMGFFCDLDGDDEIILDEHELEFAQWLDRKDLPQEDSDYSLTRDMMRVLRLGQDSHYPVVSD